MLDYRKFQSKIDRLQPCHVANTERPHGLKYSLFYGRDGQRIVGYDNESGKGDHWHYRDREEPYAFTDVDTLVADFPADVAREQRA